MAIPTLFHQRIGQSLQIIERATISQPLVEIVSRHRVPLQVCFRVLQS